MSEMRGTGGNRFIAADSDCTMLAAAIHRGLRELDEWAEGTGRTFDAGAITVETRRVRSGLISVSVTGDLIDPHAAHLAAQRPTPAPTEEKEVAE